MIDQADHIDAIFLVARHGRAAPKVADTHYAQAAGKGDTSELRRWRTIRRLIRRAIQR